MSERHLRAIKPLGTFHAVATRDSVGLERDGQTFYDANDLSTLASAQWEIMFGDGEWMLASHEDLRWADDRGSRARS